MVEVLCAVIAACSTVLCSLIALKAERAEKQRKVEIEQEEERAKQRSKEGRLQLAMIAANSELTVGVAMALKNGHCNGEVERGLEAVTEANKRYSEFLESVAIGMIREEG